MDIYLRSKSNNVFLYKIIGKEFWEYNLATQRVSHVQVPYIFSDIHYQSLKKPEFDALLRASGMSQYIMPKPRPLTMKDKIIQAF